MPVTLWPPPPTKEEFERRWNAGARTFAELDPDIIAWADAESRRVRIMWTILGCGIGLSVIAAIIMVVIANA